MVHSFPSDFLGYKFLSHSISGDCLIKDYYFPLQALRHYVGVQFPPEATANLRTALMGQAQS